MKKKSICILVAYLLLFIVNVPAEACCPPGGCGDCKRCVEDVCVNKPDGTECTINGCDGHCRNGSCICDDYCCSDADCPDCYSCFYCSSCEDDCPDKKCCTDLDDDYCCESDETCCDGNCCDPDECCIDGQCVGPRCDNCHSVFVLACECGHLPFATECSSERCLENIFFSDSCDDKGPNWPCQKTHCDTKPVGGDAVTQIVRERKNCPTGGQPVELSIIWEGRWGCEGCYPQDFRAACLIDPADCDPCLPEIGRYSFGQKCACGCP